MDDKHYTSIDRIEIITGIPCTILLGFSLNTDSIKFYSPHSSGMVEVSRSSLEKIKKYHDKGEQLPPAQNFVQKMTRVELCQLHMTDQDIRKCITYAESCQEDNVEGNIIPSEHPFTPEGLQVAFECWNYFYGKLTDKEEDEAKQITVIDREKWIKKNHPKISDNFKAEIAKVANPFPAGGKKKKK